ncbi:MAG: formimidoylglutamase [Saprospiraceae bacterium]|nr:formimidoylglutamase [Lewinella sp.]
MPHFQPFTTDTLKSYLKVRPNEVKLGQQILIESPDRTKANYVLVGLPEDIGVRANHGIGGTQTSWPAFLQAFLNIQSTADLPGDDLCLYGQLDVSDLSINPEENNVDKLRNAVEQIDRSVEKIIYNITAADKIPIVIGGGHNNTYPIIKGAVRGYAQNKRIASPSINAINLDAHADFRPLEGRHSGNGFRYAFSEGHLDRYAVIGLHRNYNAASMLENMQNESRIDLTFWEDIFLKKTLSFDQAIQRALGFTRGNLSGIELDLDCIENVLSSATTPSGVSTLQARQYIHQTAGFANVAYVHICEGAASLSDGRKDQSVSKLIAYLVSDFIREHRKNNLRFD